MVPIFAYRKSLLGHILEGPWNEKCLYALHLVHFTAIWNMLWQYGIFCGHLVIFCHFGML
jgi:hypothetical protein